MASFLLLLLLLHFFSASFLIPRWTPRLSLASASAAPGGPTFGFPLHHRFSDPVRKWAKSHPGGSRPFRWPEKGTVEYYAALAHHDRALRGQALSDAAPALTFSAGNATQRISSLGFLHYAMVSIGTPSVTFMVALDTGSDLLWVPCDCISCAPTSSANHGSEFEISSYSPNMSLTSQRVPCNSHFCELESECSETTSDCPYKAAYVSADTSSSGFLVEDVLYLTTEDSRPEVVEAQIVFGCGQVQTGSFLDAAAPNGLLGLGMENISVPSIISSAGLTSDSFSMCFGHDGSGRISFGDQGTSDQEETPFNLNQLHPTYNISITEIEVGINLIDVEFTALVDSGTSFTYLADPAYTSLSKSFNSQAQDNRHPADPRIPFEYCYHMSSNNATIQLPDVTLTTKGGSQFPVSYPIIVISIQQSEYVYCLAVVKSYKMNIIGQNFLSGLQVVFDRERLVMGWKKFNCYNTEDSSSLPAPWSSSARPPVGAVGPNNNTPEAATGTGNSTQVTELTPPINHSSHLSCVTSISLKLFFYLLSFQLISFSSGCSL